MKLRKMLPNTIARLKLVAEQKGGTLISTGYEDNKSRLRWRCVKGHEWLAKADVVAGKQDSWCPECWRDRSRLGVDAMHKLAEVRGGKCLSKSYINASTKLSWECAHGHLWDTTPAVIRRGYWCPECAGQGALTMEKLQATALNRGGVCVSGEIVSSLSTMLWRCSEGHEWEAKIRDVRQGHWCRTCSTGISERMCRASIEHLTGYSFPKAKPVWFKNSRGNQMEMDGYAPELNLVFEYHGQQHYEVIKYLGDTANSLFVRQQDDITRRELCRAHGLDILEIPYHVKPDQRHAYIAERLGALRPALALNTQPLDMDKANVWSDNQMRTLRKLAASKGGVVMSRHYLGSATKLQFKCGQGHKWSALPGAIKQGKWCRECFYERLRKRKT